MKLLQRYLAGLACALAVALPAQAEVSEFTITRQPSILYLPATIMEHDHLIEKHAKQIGLGNLKVHWKVFTSGGAASDALMAGQIQMLISGMSNMLLLWDRTHGQVRGAAGAAVIPQWLVTRDAAVKSVKDFSDRDRIAVPTVKVSNQAIFLKMAAEKAIGPAGRDGIDRLTIQQGHPDATVAILSGRSNINSHFSVPPYQEQEVATPGVHRVLSSASLGKVSTGTFFTTVKFHDANPKTYAAFLAALKEAEDLINRNPRLAAEKYKEVTHEKYSVDELMKLIKSPENIYTMTPYGTRLFADFMYKDHLLKTKMTSWKDAFFPEVHKLPGN